MARSHAFLEELKRRQLWRVAVAYAVAGWLLVQVATQVFPFFNIPNWGVRLVVILIAIGFPVAVAFACGACDCSSLTSDGEAAMATKPTSRAEPERRTCLSVLASPSRPFGFRHLARRPVEPARQKSPRGFRPTQAALPFTECR